MLLMFITTDTFYIAKPKDGINVINEKAVYSKYNPFSIIYD